MQLDLVERIPLLRDQYARSVPGCPAISFHAEKPTLKHCNDYTQGTECAASLAFPRVVAQFEFALKGRGFEGVSENQLSTITMEFCL
jgi:hypothetical protein